MSHSDLDPALASVAELAREASHRELAEGEQQSARRAFMLRANEQLEAEQAPRRVFFWPIPAALLVAAAVAFWFLSPRDLTFQVAGAEVDGTYVRAPASQPADVIFSDQSRLTVLPDARVRVESTNPHGARVLVERGRTDVHVVHRDDSAWTFVAGPFEVKVTGTRFGLTWDPATETIEVVMTEGSVEVQGPSGTGPVALRAGQHFRGDAQRQSMAVTSAGVASPEPAPKGAAPEPPAAPPSAPGETPGSDTATAPSSKPTESWQRLITQGKFQRIVDEANARGVRACLEGCSGADLSALADAARYVGRRDVAEQSLLALRKRFAGGAGKGAAFSLGRLNEERGAAAEARTWYRTYLAESGSGSFAAEAMAGQMRTTLSLEGKQAAAPLAREYLKRYPSGVHAKTAREIIGQP